MKSGTIDSFFNSASDPGVWENSDETFLSKKMILYYLKLKFRVFPPPWTLNEPWLFDSPLPTFSRLYILLISNQYYNVQHVPLNFLVTSSIGSLPGGVLRAVEDPY